MQTTRADQGFTRTSVSVAMALLAVMALIGITSAGQAARVEYCQSYMLEHGIPSKNAANSLGKHLRVNGKVVVDEFPQDCIEVIPVR